MVVLSPLLPGERIRICTRCNHVGLESPVKERTSFYSRMMRGQRKYEASCRRCDLKRVRRWREENLDHRRAYVKDWTERQYADPEAHRRMNEKAAEAARRRRARPEVRKREADTQRRYRARLMADPERHQRMLEDQRIAYRLRQERKGVPLPDGQTPDSASTHLQYPPAPVRKVLDALLAQAREEEVPDPEETVAAHIGMSSRRLRRIRCDFVVLDEVQVDDVATALNMLVEDFYSPELRQLAHDNRPLARRAKKVRGSAREVLAWIARVERTCEGLA